MNRYETCFRLSWNEIQKIQYKYSALLTDEPNTNFAFADLPSRFKFVLLNPTLVLNRRFLSPTSPAIKWIMVH